MSKFRALLIGVNDYSNPRPTRIASQPKAPISKPIQQTVWVNADLPSAKADVRNMRDLLESRASDLDYDSVEGVALLGAEDTTRNSIRNWMAWLATSAEAGDQLLLYFSGHSTWVPRAVPQSFVDGRQAVEGGARDVRRPARERARASRIHNVPLEVALCPSDTTWQHGFISALDVLSVMNSAFQAHACLEVILETCSAQGIARQFRGLPRKSFLEGALNPRGYARWDAAELDQSSHSAPVPPCKGEVQGLFTHFLCNELKAGGTRDEVLSRVRGALDTYWKERRRNCNCPEPPGPFKQTPQLSGGTSEFPFGGTCHGQEHTPAVTKVSEIDWIYTS